jgi:saccharopine dehydrogenase-like NADP-dependent oxidoreductase
VAFIRQGHAKIIHIDIFTSILFNEIWCYEGRYFWAPFEIEMKKILIIGAGRSSANLIKYLLDHSLFENWIVRVGDRDIDFVRAKLDNHPKGEAFAFDAMNELQRKSEIQAADLVISMLPASMHVAIAKDCIECLKPVITPSYVASEMWELDEEAKAKGVLILNEMGVDPGIDHMSAMKIIHHLKECGAQLQSFESFTGGLIAPESDNNPWNYKITWNPRNVVLAGYGGTARFQEEGELKFIPYHRLFERITAISIDKYGSFDGYANRDSLKYKDIYGLSDIPTIYRGTLRRGGFCQAWNALVQIGLTDDSFQIEHPEGLNWKSLTASFLDMKGAVSVEQRFRESFELSEETFSKLLWLGVFSDRPLGIKEGSPAVALQNLIEEKWKLDSEDKDMIVMWHRFVYDLDGARQELISSLITPGDDPVYTAMSKTVGLPIAIAARMVLNGKIKLTGIQLPVIPEIYVPVLNELTSFGIVFSESVTPL